MVNNTTIESQNNTYLSQKKARFRNRKNQKGESGTNFCGENKVFGIPVIYREKQQI